MKKFIKFIAKTLIFLLVLFIVFLFCTYIASKRNNTTISNTLIQFQTVGSELIDFTFTDKNSVDISSGITSNSNINTEEKTSTTSSSITNRYFYTQLDDNAKVIYKSLEDNINNLKNEKHVINFSNKFNDLLHEPSGEYKLNKAFQSALDAFFYDHPELFYIDLTKISLNITCSSIGPIDKYTVKLAPSDDKNYFNNSFSSKAEVENAIEKVENIRNNFIKEFEGSNDYTKILNVHNALANSLEYDSTLSKKNIHNIYGAFINKEVVCEGYAKAFKYILDSLGIESILVSGEATNSSGVTESHMWNYVKLNDSWYGVDVTWDDPIIIGGSNKNNVRQDYFLRGHRTFARTHFPSGKISDTGILFKLPKLSDNNYR